MKQDKLFIDTGAWIALIVKKDQFHTVASNYYKNLYPSVKRITSSYVIGETYTWLRCREGFLYANRFLNIIEKSKKHGFLHVILENQEILERAEQFLRDYQDQKLSYTDAVSMAIMKKEQIQKAFGFDKHFYILNFQLVP